MHRAIVTGGAGFIGSHVVDRLINDGLEVIVIDNESSECNAEFYYNDKAKYYKYNIEDYDLIEPLFKGVDYVFHLAAESRIQPTLERPVKACMTNIVGTCNVLEASRRNNIKRVIYSSTSSAYGLKNKIPLKETMHRDCLNPYSVTKVAAEDLCKMYHSLYGLETVIFRYFNVYGERQPLKGQYAPVVGLFLEMAKNNKPMTVVGDGLQTRDYTYVKDVVEANMLAMCSDDKQIFGEIFNVGTGINHSVLDLVDMIEGDHVHLPPRLGESRDTLADNKKLINILGWQPKEVIDNWIQKYKMEITI
jgi:UDP-glucose 4-epimerase